VAEYRAMVAPVTEGDVLAGKYRVEKVLGAGGMGVVVAARHLQLDEQVALKFLLPAALEVHELVARFAREARVAVKIKSEHVARIIDVGELDSGAPYIVMEYLRGQDLSQLLASQGAIPMGDAIEYLLQACEAIAEAHSLGIVHRDLKPANLFLTHRVDGSACVKVLDFGISKVSQLASSAGATSLSMTNTSAMLGSPYYLSPEQIASAKTVDTRTDIWSLGVIAYQLLSGQTPFNGDNIGELCASILQRRPKSLVELNRNVPLQLERAIAGALEKDREQRYASVAELALALRPFAPARAQLSVERVSSISFGSRRSSSASPTPSDRVRSSGAPATQTVPEPAAASGAADHGTLNAAWDRSAGRSQSLRRSTRLGLLLMGAATLIGGGFFALSQRKQVSTTPAATVSFTTTPLVSPTPAAVQPAPSAVAKAVKPTATAPIVLQPMATAHSAAAAAASASSRPAYPARAATKPRVSQPVAGNTVSHQPVPLASSSLSGTKSNTVATQKPSIADLLDARH
jgi:serine/threonine-protein kinase